MTSETYEWADTSKLVHYRKSLKAYFLIPFFISLAIFIMMLKYFMNSFSSFSNDTFIAGFFLFCIVAFMFGPVLAQKYKMKRDVKGYRIAYNNNKFLLISEEDNKIKESIPIESIQAIFLDYASIACFIAKQPKEVELLEKIYSSYDERNRNFMLTGDIAHALRRDWAPLAYVGGVYTSINLFYLISKVVSGSRLIQIKQLEDFIDSLQVFDKTTTNSKYYGTKFLCVYKKGNSMGQKSLVHSSRKTESTTKPTLSQKFLGKQSRYPKLYAFHFYSLLIIIGSFLFGWLIYNYLLLVGFVLLPFFIISGGLVSYLDEITLVGPLKLGRIEGTPAKVIGVIQTILGILILLMLLSAVFFLSLLSYLD